MTQIIQYPFSFRVDFIRSDNLATDLKKLFKRTREPKPFTSDSNIFIAKLFEDLRDKSKASEYICFHHTVDAILIVLYAQKGAEDFKRWHSKFHAVSQKKFFTNRNLLLNYLGIKIDDKYLNKYDYLSYAAEIIELPWFKNNATP